MKAFGIDIKFLREILLATFLSLPLLFVGYGCDTPEPSMTMDSLGDFTKCTYSNELTSLDFSSAMVYYPCEKADGPFAATTLTGGWINQKEDVAWIAEHLVTHGYIVIAMTPNNNMGQNEQWEKAHKAGFKTLIAENQRPESPLFGLVDEKNLQLMGFSKGGGGALLAAADLGDQIKSTQALAPFMDQDYELDAIRSATACYSGSEDLIASNGVMMDLFNSLPPDIVRTMAIIDNAAHLDWMNEGNYHDRLITYILAWMKYHLNGDGEYEKYIQGTQNWLHDFKQFTAGTELKGGCN